LSKSSASSRDWRSMVSRSNKICRRSRSTRFPISSVDVERPRLHFRQAISYSSVNWRAKRTCLRSVRGELLGASPLAERSGKTEDPKSGAIKDVVMVYGFFSSAKKNNDLLSLDFRRTRLWRITSQRNPEHFFISRKMSCVHCKCTGTSEWIRQIESCVRMDNFEEMCVSQIHTHCPIHYVCSQSQPRRSRDSRECHDSHSDDIGSRNGCFIKNPWIVPSDTILTI
jgi:hypothetical protein